MTFTPDDVSASLTARLANDRSTEIWQAAALCALEEIQADATAGIEKALELGWLIGAQSGFDLLAMMSTAAAAELHRRDEENR